MKNPPTLADMCIASAYGEFGGRGEMIGEIRSFLLTIANARKFVLDRTMSRFLADLTYTLRKGGDRKRLVMMDNCRHMARLPHALTWIEFDYLAYIERCEEVKTNYQRSTDGNNPPHMGWLIRQHHHNPAAFKATELRGSPRWPSVFLHPVSYAWVTDDEPSPWRRYFCIEDENDVRSFHSTATIRENMTNFILEKFLDKFGDDEVYNTYVKPSMPYASLWSLLATINDLPTKIEWVEPSKGYINKGRYKKFLKHSVVTLTVPETVWRKLVIKAATILRRRAHAVRGHWRKDWHFPARPDCDHVWLPDSDALVCRRCRGRCLWIAEHQRGDASLGFVTHDYEIKHAEETAA